jgi:hypothetical protein
MVAGNFGITRLCLHVLVIQRAMDIAFVTDPIARLEAAVDSGVEWLQKRLHTYGYCSITTVTRIFGDLVLNRAELCSRMNVQILIARIHVRGQLSSRVGDYLNSRLVHVWCHLTSRPLMTPRDVNS